MGTRKGNPILHWTKNIWNLLKIKFSSSFLLVMSTTIRTRINNYCWRSFIRHSKLKQSEALWRDLGGILLIICPTPVGKELNFLYYDIKTKKFLFSPMSVREPAAVPLVSHLRRMNPENFSLFT